MLFTHVLAPNCIATLLDFSSSGMPVSVRCRDHEYTATYPRIVNLQMRKSKKKKKKGMPKKNNCKFEKESADVHDIWELSEKSQPSLACDNLHMYARWLV